MRHRCHFSSRGEKLERETDPHFLLFSSGVKEHQGSYDYCIYLEACIQIAL